MMLVNISNAVVVALLVFFARERDTLALDSSQTGLIYTIAAV